MPVTSPKISRAAVELIRTRLADPVIGFNPQFARIIADEPLYAHANDIFSSTPLNINFSLTPPSRNFILGQVEDMNEIFKWKHVSAPLITLYGISTNTEFEGVQKRSIFAGHVPVGLDFYMSWRAPQLHTDLETPGNAVEDTLYAIFNTQGGAYTNLLSTGPIYYTRHLDMIAKSPVSRGGDNWQQLLKFRFIVKIQY
jgi:hypothetical protein